MCFRPTIASMASEMCAKGSPVAPPPRDESYYRQLAAAQQAACAQMSLNQYAELYKYGLANAFAKPADYQPRPAPKATSKPEPADPTTARFKGIKQELG